MLKMAASTHPLCRKPAHRIDLRGTGAPLAITGTFTASEIVRVSSLSYPVCCPSASMLVKKFLLLQRTAFFAHSQRPVQPVFCPP
jgi:hypothetical protein